MRSVGKPKPWARPLWIGHGVERLVHVFTSTKHIELMRRWWLNAACIGDMINEGERAWQQTTKGTRSGSAEEIVPVAPLANLTTGEQATRSWGSLF
ncbi:hypothetical protein [Saccharopolyspora sp. ASAGF58]|uniref:hypothetical protein n=1 Tax=Saccharopolyspora sp. ASAGF58 TaxID=2719023 RepID=UPI0014402342|nr:hypothetical protein [Saccharopolyspora sp. ASAGF58]QIZ38588.1 hypothetical protein FDZ84_33755 [Saccharopolyspora sp. ASAGF58]